MLPKAQSTGEKLENLDFINSKIFYASKDTRKWKNNLHNDRLFVNHVSFNGLKSRICKTITTTTKRQTTQLKNGQRTWIDISPKKTYKCWHH